MNEVLSWELSQARYFDPTFGGAVVAGQRNIVQSGSRADRFRFSGRPSQLFADRFRVAVSAEDRDRVANRLRSAKARDHLKRIHGRCPLVEVFRIRGRIIR